MTTDAEKRRLLALTNELALATTTQLIEKTNELSREFGPLAAVTVTVDAALTAAVAVVQSALLAGSIEPTIPMEEALRKRFEYVLALPTRLHQRQPGGSFDPAGVALN